MKALRWIGIAVLVLVVVIVAAAVILPQVIDPNDYKDQITAAVKDQTGRELSIPGDLKLSVFPWLGVEAGEMSLSNAQGFGDRPFARIQHAEVRVRLLPLLSRKLEASTVTLDGLALNLARKADGRSNWDDLAKPADESAQQAAAEEADDGRGQALAALAIGGVEIRDAQLVWDDQASKAHYEISDLDLVLGAILPGQPIDFDLGVSLNSTAPQMDARVTLTGVLGIGEELQRFDLKDVRLGVDARGAELPNGAIKATVKTAAVVDLKAQTLDVPSLVAEVLDLTLKASVQGKGLTEDKPSFTGTLKVEEFVPRELLRQLGQTLPEMSDPTVLGKAALDANFAATTSSADLSKLALRFDDSSLTGKASVSNFAKPAIRFDMALDRIDVDRYLPPPPPDEVKAAPTPAEAAAVGAGSLPVDTLRGLDVAGSFRIGELKAYQLRSSDVLVTLKAKDGVVRVHPAEARLYEGQYNGDISLDVRGAQPKISLNEKVAGVQAGPLLKDLTGDDKLLGRADVSANLTGVGQDPDAIQKTLNGNLAFSFRNGAVKGINVAQLIREAKARLEGKPVPAATGPNQTDFTEMGGTAQVVNGVIHNNDLVAKSPLLRIEGKGKVDLPQQALDYLVTTKLVSSLTGQGGESLDDLKGVAIPLRIKGTFAEPRFNVELDKVLKQAVEKKVKEKVQEKVQDKIDDKVKDALGDKLKGIFGR